MDKIFHLNPESVSHPRNIVEIANNLDGIVDGAIVKTVFSKEIEIFGGHLTLMVGEFRGKITKGSVWTIQGSCPPISGNCMNIRVRILVKIF